MPSTSDLQATESPTSERRLGSASVTFTPSRLRVSTGRVERIWNWTGGGWSSISFRDLQSDREWLASPQWACDWDLPGSKTPPPTNNPFASDRDFFLPEALDDSSLATLCDISIRESDDDGFSNPHLEVVSTIRYESARLEIQHVVWVFPGAPGLRTQLRVKALPGFDPMDLQEADGTYKDCGATFPKPSARSEHLPLDFAIPNERLYWGYYNNPGNRHDQSQDMLKEQVVKGWPIFLREDIDWASGVAVKYGDAGVMLVKESPKCVNQAAHHTGAFYSRPWGLCSTGWGLTPKELVPDRFRECWAHWTMVYQGGDDGLQRALKEFDAARYPVFPERDLFILSNTWGPANPMGGQFTEEDFVLKEIPLLAGVGVDVMQIDDGWQMSGELWDAKDFRPKYTNGWKDIKAVADRHGLRLGLWVAIRNANLDELDANLDDLGFITWKADFDCLDNRADYEHRLECYREVMKHAWMKTQFTLCPEYDDPRYGWYFAKEYGSIYFQNIQEGLPDHLTMVPYQVLRQHWLMARYFPANKLQVLLQNPKRTRTDLSDAHLHGHGYCFAMGLPFVPCFFQSAQFLDEEGRQELKELIALYKTCREDIFTSTTYPIGDLPDNESWAGFQMVSNTTPGAGHLLLFRELHNPHEEHAIRLKFVAGQSLTLRDLRTGITRRTAASNEGFVHFQIESPADYALLHYSVALAP